MKRGVIAMLILAVAAASGEILDRIAVTVDQTVVTQSRIYREIRLTALLNDEPVDFAVKNRRATAERLVDQALIRHEMEMTRYPMPAPEEAEELLKQVKKSAFSNEDEYRKLLAEYEVTEDELREHLLRQLGTLRFIDLRFRPEVQVTEPEVQTFCDTEFVPELKKRNLTPEPSFDELRTLCEEALVDRRADAVAERWLKEMRGRTEIRFREEAFR